MDNLRTRLLHPFSQVTLTISVDGPNAVRLWYSGPADQLVASGAIEPAMAERSTLGTGPKARRSDSYGDYFSRSKTTSGLRVFRDVTNGARALGLPGMRDYFPKGLPDELERYIAEREAGDRIATADWYRERQDDRVVSAVGAKYRKRSVGRFRRDMEWASSENVIFIDWGKLRRERRSAGNAA